MSTVKKIFTSPFFIIALFALAAALLLLSGIGGARAALSSQSEVYSLDIDAQHIGVKICENGTEAEEEALQLVNVPADANKVRQGESYDEVLTVRNPSTTTSLDGEEYNSIDEYVRVIVYKYWVDENGNKIPEDVLSPDLIQLHFVTDNGWVINDNENKTTSERTVLSYDKVLAPGEETTAFVDGISFDVDFSDYFTTETVTGVDADGNFTSTTVTAMDVEGYGEVHCVVKAEAQAIQTHNYREAMISAWGYVPSNIA